MSIIFRNFDRIAPSVDQLDRSGETSFRDNARQNPVNCISHPALGPRILGAIVVLSGDIGVAPVIVPDIDPFLAKVSVRIEKMGFHRAPDIARLETLHAGVIAKPPDRLGDAGQR